MQGTLPGWRLAVDVGGTFIDFALVHAETGRVIVEKQPSDPRTLVDEFMAGLARLPVAPGDLDLIVHGTTHGLNALVQETGASTGLLTTRGFRDVLQIGRAARVNMYDPHYAPRPPLIRRSRIHEISERFDVHGEEILPLSLSDVDEAADALVRVGVQSIAIAFLHSYRYPAHEQRAAERIRERHPSIAVTCSSDLTREWREYERSSTAVANAFIQTGFAAYVDLLQQRLREAGYARDIVFVQSNGGTMPAGIAAAQPVRTLNSGPAGGITGAGDLARRLGLDNVIATDVGGTTYDVGLILGGEAQERSITTAGGRPILAPSIDIVSIGAGGGSIAQIDALTGGLRIGPESAGAVPGPVCFGRGGQRPTLTDCQLQLGRLDPDRFLESRMTLDAAAATASIEQALAEPSGMSADEAADGALEVAEANMANAIRQITTERGLDPADFTVLSYGGGGGLFAAFVCENLGIRQVVIPPHTAAFSAWGMLSSGFREDRTATSLRPLAVDTVPDVLADLEGLVAEATAQLRRYGLDLADARIVRRLDLRYAGQAHSLEITLDDAWPDSAEAFLEGASAAFHAAHRRRYGHGDANAPLEAVAARIRVSFDQDIARPGAEVEPAAAEKRTRSIHFRGLGRVQTPVIARRTLEIGERLAGPAVVDDTATTIIVPPGWSAHRHGSDSLVLEKEETR
ncbi:hydantoinase/oxoprolinase family protein [Microbacterium panaciterrae]|uniref:Hydantoinase/oxoprolinase family protein n=1 Tax=Microbacterium panaciterrae TaxID=985759 RepID=A0ABP8PLJ5_9MICO